MTRAGLVKTSGQRFEEWEERIAAQQRSGLSVKQFCAERGLTEPSFYFWRKRLQGRTPLRFALVETGGTSRKSEAQAPIEVVLRTGERLCIGASVDVVLLRKVLEALRG